MGVRKDLLSTMKSRERSPLKGPAENIMILSPYDIGRPKTKNNFPRNYFSVYYASYHYASRCVQEGGCQNKFGHLAEKTDFK